MSRVLQRCGVLMVGVFVLSLVNPLGGAISVAAGDSRYFPETGQTISNAFYEFWLNHGQTEILGLPITPAYTRKDGTIQQIYERAIMEWRPENSQPNRVLLQLLGRDDLDDIEKDRASGNVDDRTVNPRPCAPGASCETFAATKHTTVGAFRDFWYAHGGLATFGYPLSEEFGLKTFDNPNVSYTVQFFERNRMEWHPEINGGTILLGRLGVRIWNGVTSQSAILASKEVVPDYDGVIRSGPAPVPATPTPVPAPPVSAPAPPVSAPAPRPIVPQPVAPPPPVVVDPNP